MTTEELLLTLRATLKPAGSADLVRLNLRNLGFVPTVWVDDAINQLEILMITQEKASPLEKLGIQLLLDSIDYKNEQS